MHGSLPPSDLQIAQEDNQTNREDQKVLIYSLCQIWILELCLWTLGYLICFICSTIPDLNYLICFMAHPTVFHYQLLFRFGPDRCLEQRVPEFFLDFFFCLSLAYYYCLPLFCVLAAHLMVWSCAHAPLFYVLHASLDLCYCRGFGVLLI